MYSSLEQVEAVVVEAVLDSHCQARVVQPKRFYLGEGALRILCSCFA